MVIIIAFAIWIMCALVASGVNDAVVHDESGFFMALLSIGLLWGVVYYYRHKNPEYTEYVDNQWKDFFKSKETRKLEARAKLTELIERYKKTDDPNICHHDYKVEFRYYCSIYGTDICNEIEKELLEKYDLVKTSWGVLYSKKTYEWRKENGLDV